MHLSSYHIYVFFSGVHLDGLLPCTNGTSVLYEDLRYDMIMSVYENESGLRRLFLLLFAKGVAGFEGGTGRNA